jgi:hypothetical protein
MSTDDYLENLAIFSMIAGVAAVIFALFGGGTILAPLALFGGAAAVASGVRVLRSAAANKKIAVTGAVTGTIAVAIWLLTMVCQVALAVWHMVWR